MKHRHHPVAATYATINELVQYYGIQVVRDAMKLIEANIAKPAKGDQHDAA